MATAAEVAMAMDAARDRDVREWLGTLLLEEGEEEEEGEEGEGRGEVR